MRRFFVATRLMLLRLLFPFFNHPAMSPFEECGRSSTRPSLTPTDAEPAAGLSSPTSGASNAHRTQMQKRFSKAIKRTRNPVESTPQARPRFRSPTRPHAFNVSFSPVFPPTVFHNIKTPTPAAQSDTRPTPKLSSTTSQTIP